MTYLFQRNKFLDVLQYIDLADNNNLDSNDKFAKLQPLFQILNKNCLKNFIPQRNASIDKSIEPYYGRHGCKQYMQSKPVRFVYKLWVAATPLGYPIQFYPYAGKDVTIIKSLVLVVLWLCHWFQNFLQYLHPVTMLLWTTSSQVPVFCDC